MPWKETCVMDEKIKFIADWLTENYSLSELSEKYMVSRKTLYKWIDRYDNQGLEGLLARSSAPLNRPRTTPKDIAATILATKSKYTRWGPRKLIAFLKRHYPDRPWPAISTAQSILKREGWIKARHHRHHTPPYTQPFHNVLGPNDVWSMDFKGQFRLGEGKLCYPLTVTDSYSRYLLLCQGLYRPTQPETKRYLERVFQEYGLPLAIRTDNGAPFASVAIGGLSSLAVWLIKLGIHPERIEPGQPQQNGRHERFHRTLKESTINPPRYTLVEQQRVFDRFQPVYNQERPHESLGQVPPAVIYQPSQRVYPAQLTEVEYARDFIVRQVRQQGRIKWNGGLIYVSKTLIGEPIGLKPIEDYVWEVYYSFYRLGVLDARINRIISI